ncbi:copine [Skeletonema marinoi]|uniref:Copine n=1 Tax=Skeletonema marinoi TaxID=267567 RepID=A0AAD8Y6X0_9STRA|nr:copine [Skeletonema marinoi]
MVVSAEQARQKAEARRQRILAKSAERLDMASNGMASKEVEHSVPLSPVRRRRNQNKKKKTVEKLRLTLHATKLKNVAGLGKGISDPYANVTLVTSGRELILGQTEVVKNSIHPTWTSSFLFDYNKGEKMSIEVSVVDEVKKGSDIPMGSAAFEIGDILGSQGSIKGKELKEGGMLHARISKVPSRSAGKLSLRLEGKDLRNVEISKSDPLFELCRTYDGGKSWTPVYRSEYVMNNLNPDWKAASIDVNALCDGDLKREIKLAIFDYERKGENKPLGAFYTTVNDLMQSENSKLIHSGNVSKAHGTIFVHECKITGAEPEEVKPPEENDVAEEEEAEAAKKAEEERAAAKKAHEAAAAAEAEARRHDIEEAEAARKAEEERAAAKKAQEAAAIEAEARRRDIEDAEAARKVATKEAMPSNKKGKPPKDPSIKTTATNTTGTTTASYTATSHNDVSSRDGGKSTTSSTVNSTSSKKSQAVNFLSAYEEMIRQQDHEYDVTTKHLRRVFDRVQYLGRSNDKNKAPQDGRGYERILTYSQIRRCLLRTGITWNRSLPVLIDDDVSVTSFNSSSVASSGSGGPFHTGGRKRDIITTDAQLIMLLTALVEAEEHYRVEQSADNNNDEVDRRGIYFPEFVQCYQLIVAGMQSLQVLEVGEDAIKAQIVDRVKERTFGLIRPFGPDTTVYKEDTNLEGAATDGGDGLLPSSKRSGLSAKGRSMRENNTKEGLDENEIKLLIQSKDSRLAMLIKEHEEEMDVLAKGMESLRSKHARTRKLIKLRRGLLFVGAIILGVGVLTLVVTREHQRRVDVADGIATFREAEMKANAKTIAKLSEKRDVLGRKVGDTEGTMRYLVNRNEGIDASIEELEARLNVLI